MELCSVFTAEHSLVFSCTLKIYKKKSKVFGGRVTMVFLRWCYYWITCLMSGGSSSAHTGDSRRWTCSLSNVLQEKLSTSALTSQSHLLLIINHAILIPLVIKTTILVPLIIKNTILISLLGLASDMFPVSVPVKLEGSTMLLLPPQQTGGTCGFPIYLLVK